MKYASTLMLLASAAYSAVSAQYLQLYSPTEGEVLTANQDVNIEWQLNETGANLGQQSMNIELVYGESNNARTALTVAKDLNAIATQYKWKIQDNLVPRNDYFLKFSHITANGRQFSFGTRFEIKGTTGTVDPGRSNAGSLMAGASTAAAAGLTAALLL